jgi:phosphoribosylformimino-5-aminoimidazole carboxamide ribotide isomerase
MQIIPVLDLKGGVVVRGVAGRRDEYRPIESRLCEGSAVGDVARALRQTFACNTCYLADLDAIAGGEPSLLLYDEVVATGMCVWLDAGTGTLAAARRVARYFTDRNVAGRVVVGLESVADEAALRSIVEAVGTPCVVFSLDLKQGLPLTDSPGWAGRTPVPIAAAAIAAGIGSLIVLDLAGVGVGQGVPTLDLCRRLRAEHPDLEIVTGGGVRGIADLEAIRDAGCDGTLVASALHDGRISPEDLKAWSERRDNRAER